jgi:hypothetical protein
MMYPVEIKSYSFHLLLRSLYHLHDLAGSINDLAVMHMANRDYLSAEKQLKRALLMVERSYRVDNHLRSALIANLSDLHCISGNKDLSLQYADLLLPCINAHQFIPTKGSAVDLTEVAAIETSDINSVRFSNIQSLLKDRIEIENALDQLSAEDTIKESVRVTVGKEESIGGINATNENNFYYSRDNMNELKLVAKEGIKKEIKQKGIGLKNRFYYSRDTFASIRTVQYVLSAGLCIGVNRLHEEGLIHINRAFDLILINSSQENPQNFLYQDSFLLSVALSKLATLSDHSMKTRNRGLSSKHIQNDNIKNLFNLPYFKQNFPGLCDLELSLSSTHRDLKNAATQIYKKIGTSPIKQTNKYSNKYIVSNKTEHNLSEYDLLSQYGLGIVGIALMDIEVHCPPDVTK